MHDSGTGTQAGGRASALRLGLLGIAELWSQLWLGIDNKVLTQLMDGLRFADGQGQLWPLRVLALDARLRRPLRAAGCAVVVDEAPYPAERVPTGPELADGLCALLTTTELIPLVRGYARRVRLGGARGAVLAAGVPGASAAGGGAAARRADRGGAGAGRPGGAHRGAGHLLARARPARVGSRRRTPGRGGDERRVLAPALIVPAVQRQAAIAHAETLRG